METLPIVILGGGVVAGYAAKEFVAQSTKGTSMHSQATY